MKITLELDTDTLTHRQLDALALVVHGALPMDIMPALPHAGGEVTLDSVFEFKTDADRGYSRDVALESQRSAAELREEAIAQAMKFDGADERVRRDWSGPNGAETEAGIPRDRVNLRVGDVVCFYCSPGVTHTVTHVDSEISSRMPVRTTYFCTTPQGIAYIGNKEIARVTRVNGAPIVDPPA